MVTTLAIAAVLSGYLLGIWFKVYILIPVIPLGVAVAVTVGFALDSSASAILLAAILTVTGFSSAMPPRPPSPSCFRVARHHTMA